MLQVHVLYVTVGSSTAVVCTYTHQKMTDGYAANTRESLTGTDFFTKLSKIGTDI